MLKNYFKTALRNLARYKIFTVINIIGLAVGIASCLLIFMVIQFELSFDNFHNNKDRIYRLVSLPYKQGIAFNTTAGVPFPVAPALRVDFPQLENVAAIFERPGQITIFGNGKNQEERKFNEGQGVFFAEPSFFDIFHFEWLVGDPKTALMAPNKVVLTQETAERYFGDWKTAIGKSIKFRNKDIFLVTGILKNPPPNTDFPLKVVVSYKSLTKDNVGLDDWVNTYGGANCYVLLPHGISVLRFNNDLRNFVIKHKPAEYANNGLMLQPLAEIHFDGRFGNYSGRTFSKELIASSALIALFLLIIACVNFVNLATVQAVNRSKEVGIRKVLGGNQKQLFLQFMGETGLVTVFAVLLAVFLAAITLPLLNDLLKINIAPNILNNPSVPQFLFFVSLCVTGLSGFYPALIISGFNPIHTLNNKITAKIIGGISLRRGLVVLQFCIAQILIIGVLVVVSQMNYFRSAALGFNKDAIVNVPVPNDSLSESKIEVLRNQLLQHPGIKNVSFSTFTPSDNYDWNGDFKFDHATKKSDFQAGFKWADTAYFKTYGIQFVAGRPYIASDTISEFVVNESFVRKLGILNPKDILGKEINFWDEKRAPIVGVVKDFHASSLHDPIVPIVLGCWRDTYQVIGIKISPVNVKETLAIIKKRWNTVYPDYVYEYHFLEEKINSFYQQENQLSQLYKIFAGIAVFISCLGLYGLVSFMTVNRMKEVGIRKVLGASVAHIMYLFSKEFTILIGIAFLIASPLAYYFMHHWLEGFAFRIQLGIGTFLLAIAGSILVAWLTVGYQAFKAGITNPIKSLRTE